MAKFLYLCNGEIPTCTKESCYKRGGPCRHTLKPIFALRQVPMRLRVYHQEPDGSRWEDEPTPAKLYFHKKESAKK